MTVENKDEEPRIVDRRAASRMGGADGADAKAEANEAAANRSDTPAGSGDAELAAEREKAETYYRNWQRSAADFINYKRRVEQEKGESSRFVSAALVINLLPV